MIIALLVLIFCLLVTVYVKDSFIVEICVSFDTFYYAKSRQEHNKVHD